VVVIIITVITAAGLPSRIECRGNNFWGREGNWFCWLGGWIIGIRASGVGIFLGDERKGTRGKGRGKHVEKGDEADKLDNISPCLVYVGARGLYRGMLGKPRVRK
jgi:hypothetical protein